MSSQKIRVYLNNKVIFCIDGAEVDDAELRALDWAERNNYTVVDITDGAFGDTLIYVKKEC